MLMVECSIPESLTIAEYRAGRRSNSPHVNSTIAALVAWFSRKA